VGGRFVDRNIERGELLQGSRYWAGPNRVGADAFVGRERSGVYSHGDRRQVDCRVAVVVVKRRRKEWQAPPHAPSRSGSIRDRTPRSVAAPLDAANLVLAMHIAARHC
jgi:hypothetical protein